MQLECGGMFALSGTMEVSLKVISVVAPEDGFATALCMHRHIFKNPAHRRPLNLSMCAVAPILILDGVAPLIAYPPLPTRQDRNLCLGGTAHLPSPAKTP